MRLTKRTEQVHTLVCPRGPTGHTKVVYLLYEVTFHWRYGGHVVVWTLGHPRLVHLVQGQQELVHLDVLQTQRLVAGIWELTLVGLTQLLVHSHLLRADLLT